MALFPKTPGVYIQEIPVFPASVAAVPTAIPVFIGYTEKGDLKKPVRIASLLDYQQNFGGPFSEAFNVTLTNTTVDIAVTFTSPNEAQFRLFYHLQMYFANGGGPCYIIPVGHYGTTLPAPIDGGKLKDGIQYAEEVDEITLVVVPEAMAGGTSGVSDLDRKAIYDEMLIHCAKMQDRFSIMDVEVRNISIFDDASKFRSLNVGANNLKYGASYYPSFDAGLPFAYVDSDVSIVATDTNLPASVKLFNGKKLDTLLTGSYAMGAITILSTTNLAGDKFKILSVTFVAGTDFPITAGNTAQTAIDLAGAINGDGTLSPLYTATANASVVTIVAKTIGSAANATVFLYTDVAPFGPDASISPNTGTFAGGSDADNLLYNRIIASLNVVPMTLYPSSTMAGIYAAVDNDRGVWKAPANISVNLFDSLGRTITDQDQEDLNVDATSGKSINAIRNFIGRGTLVWGARTLDGNDNEWRYINVRRLFIFAEDSIKHASEFVVFEPNDKNTWVRVKGMITNFLTDLWRNGALAGDKPEQAFFVKVGLNETMSAQDILEGKLIIQVGLAAVRPAEFIILQFMHKLQEA